MYIFFNNTLYDTKSLSYRSRWKPPWERWLLGYTRMWCSLPGVKYIYEQWFVENNSVCLIEPTVIWHTKKWMHPLAIFRVHAIASIYFPDFFLDILPCLIQSQVGQILSHKISYHKLTQFSKKKICALPNDRVLWKLLY